ncbi:LuxR C-terminal-related transcriptional regulator [Kitasatospora sp. NPDC085879]|uniref:LuxR C-terminal-related transcriptional regulator n=1 Tax=Kitasatospora sp. NPDC085879 TaxID=3154769 RepID=UPI00344872B1
MARPAPGGPGAPGPVDGRIGGDGVDLLGPVPVLPAPNPAGCLTRGMVAYSPHQGDPLLIASICHARNSPFGAENRAKESLMDAVRHHADRLWPLTGRDGQFEVCREAAANPSYRGLVIRGEAGVGKTRLAEEVWRHLCDSGASGGRATATAAAAAMPLAAIAHLLPPGLDLTDPAPAFRAVAASLSGRGPRYFLLIDDLHLLDSPSAVLVRELLDDGRVFLIATLRSDLPASDAVAALDRTDETARVEIAALDEPTTEAVLTRALGGVVSRSTAHRLYERSGGNLLFLREIVLGLLASDGLQRQGAAWCLARSEHGTAASQSPGLDALVEARLGQLVPEARRVLETLAVAGPLSLAALEDLVAPEVVAGLEERDLVHVQTSRARTSVVLAHPLYGDVLRNRIPVTRHRAILARCAAHVLHKGVRRVEDPLLVASWQLASAGEASTPLILRASELAAYSHDHLQTVRLLESLPDDALPLMSRRLLGTAYFFVRRFDQAEAVLARAYAEAATEAERFRIAVDRTLNLAWSGQGAAALRVNAEALDRTNDEAMRAALEVNGASLRAFSGNPSAAVLRLLEDADHVEDERVRVYAQGIRVMTLASIGETKEARRLAADHYLTHRDASRRVVLPHPSAALMVQATAGLAGGDLEAATEAAMEGLRLALKDDAVLVVISLSVLLGRIAWLRGRPEDAHRWYSEALAISLREGVPMALRDATSGAAACAAVLGRVVEAEQLLREIDDYAEAAPVWGEESLGQAWLFAATGLVRRGGELMMEAAQRARAAGQTAFEMFFLGEAARLGAAPAVADRLAELEVVSDSSFARPLALFARAMSVKEPQLLMEEAVPALRAAGLQLMAAETAAAAAHAFHRADEARMAQAAATTSRGLADACQGAVTPGLALPSPWKPLTARENEIAVLAVQGHSSRRIAEILTLSVRTVDNHLQRVYAKLGVTSRAELADRL